MIHKYVRTTCYACLGANRGTSSSSSNFRPMTIPSISAITTTGSTVISTRRPAPVLQALAGMDALAGLQVRGATLEDVFLQLTGREYRA